MRRVLALVILLSLIVPVIGCGKSSPASFDFGSISTYRDIPGVTQEEIDEIEALRADRSRFLFGHVLETEAFVLPDGATAGFTVKLCELLTGLFGIEFVSEFYEWEDLKTGLDDFSVDFSGDLTATPERMHYYFMTHSIAERSLRIFYHADSDVYKKETDIDGCNVGFSEGTITEESVKKYYPSLSYKTVNVDSFHAAAEKLETGEIDFFVIDGVIDPFFEQYDFIASKEFFPLVYTPVSLTTANPELKSIISVMNKYITAGGIDRLYELYKEGDSEYASYKLKRSLSGDELDYLESFEANGGAVKVAYENDNYPISFYNETDGEFQGIAIDVLEEISKLTGLRFEPAFPKDTSWAEMFEEVKTGDIPMVAQLLYSDARKDDFLWSSVPYAHSYYALLSKIEYPNLAPFQVVGAKVGTITKSAHEDMYIDWFPDNDNMTQFKNQFDALDALERGDIDLMMASEYTLLTQTNYREKLGFKVNIRFSAPMDSLFGFNKDENVLRSIIDKAQPYVKTDLIAESWTSRIFDYSKQLASERTRILTIFLAVLVCVLAVMAMLLSKNIRLSRKLEALVTSDALTRVNNRRGFDAYFERIWEKSLKEHTQISLFIIDIDHFKEYNDNFGHVEGDKCLSTVANVISDSVRKNDFVARYGGEEFVVVLAGANAATSERIASGMLEAMRRQNLPHKDSVEPFVTFSIGCMVCHPYAAEISRLEFLAMADHALYMAKNQGRNRFVLHPDADK